MRRRGFILEFGNQEVTPPRQLARPVTFPRSAPQTQGDEWSRITRVGMPAMPSIRSRCTSSTRAVPSPPNSDRRACLAVVRVPHGCIVRAQAAGDSLQMHPHATPGETGWARLKAGPGQPHPLIGPEAGARLGDLPPAVLALAKRNCFETGRRVWWWTLCK
jgi:hypothetical protein